jgi:hypothetical protein
VFEAGVSIVHSSILDQQPDTAPEEVSYELSCSVLGRKHADLVAQIREQAARPPGAA